ncbi:MAG: Fic family protein [Campylobacterota bacterium]|nr:Fic family protein [Campylobacterota bacterium]
MQIDSKTINKIDIKKLDIFQANQKFSFAMAKKDKVDFVYNTSALEDNAMTYPEVATLLDGITIGGHKLSDEQQILNQNRSVDLLFKMIENHKFNLDKSTLLQLHKKVAFEEALSWGEFRKSGVNIGGTEYLPPKATNLDIIFDNGIKEIEKILSPIIKAITYFLFGAKCQFFYDGNKRTSRLIMNGVLLSNGYPILNIKAKDKLEFNTMMIYFYDSGNIEYSIRYLVDYYIKQNKHLLE